MSKMGLKPTFDELKTPFSCGWTLSGSDSKEWNTKEFATLDDAKAEYEEKASDKNLHAYLGEIGIFENDAKDLELAWFTFHTNNPEWLETSRERKEAPPENYRGWGRPLSDEAVGYIRYQSLAQLRNL